MFTDLADVQLALRPACEKLHLGCGVTRLEGWTNADLYATCATDLVFDCQEPWPLAHDSLEAVYGSHMLEHLAKPLALFQHAWRALRHQGLLWLRLPYGNHRAAWWDLEHQRPWFAENFCCVQPGYAAAIGNPQHDAWQWPYLVEQVNIRVSAKAARLLRLPLLGRWLLPHITSVPDACEELFATLRALKTPEAVESCMRSRPANFVPTQLVCYAHHWRRQPAPEAVRFQVLGRALPNQRRGYGRAAGEEP